MIMVLEDQNFAIVHPSVPEDVDILSDRVLLALSALAAFVIASTIVTRIYMALIGDPWGDPAAAPIGVTFLASATGLIIAMVIVWYWLTAEERTAAFPVRFPSTAEFGWTIAFLFPIVAITSILGIQPFDYNLANPTTAVGVFLGPILIAPFLEEALFRGLLLGSLIGRGWSPLAAGLATILLFGVGHLWIGGIALALWAVFPTILRLRFDNLSGAVLFHLLNNIYAYVIAVILFG